MHREEQCEARLGADAAAGGHPVVLGREAGRSLIGALVALSPVASHSRPVGHRTQQTSCRTSRITTQGPADAGQRSGGTTCTSRHSTGSDHAAPGTPPAGEVCAVRGRRVVSAAPECARLSTPPGGPRCCGAGRRSRAVGARCAGWCLHAPLLRAEAGYSWELHRLASGRCSSEPIGTRPCCCWRSPVLRRQGGPLTSSPWSDPGSLTLASCLCVRIRGSHDYSSSGLPAAPAHGCA